MCTINKTLTLLTVLVLTVSVSLGAASPQVGALAAKTDSDLTIQDMLLYAMQDEYAAQAEYVAIQSKFGVMRPFSNIEKAELSHIEWLKELFTAYRLALPVNDAMSRTVVPATLQKAYEIGVQAEIDNIAMYNSFLANPLLAQESNKALKDVFIHLRDASKNHLAAFQRGLAKW